MQTLRNESNDTEKHEKVIKTQYHLNSPVALQLRAPPQSKRKSPCAQVISL